MMTALHSLTIIMHAHHVHSHLAPDRIDQTSENCYYTKEISTLEVNTGAGLGRSPVVQVPIHVVGRNLWSTISASST